MTAAAFLRVKKLKGSGIIKLAARHNRRDIQAELGADSHIDPARICMNETLQGAASASGVAQTAKDLMQAAGIGNLRKDAVLCIEIIFGLRPDTDINDRAYFADCAAWAGRYFGGTQNILSVDIHRDEAAPHCHVLILPIDANNRMNGGRLLGCKTYKEWQALFYKEVASKYGLRKPPARLSGTSKDAAVKAVLQRLREIGDSALKSILWPTQREDIERDPAPYLMVLGLNVDSKLVAREKPKKTMAQIFTSKGKGAKHERLDMHHASDTKSIDIAPPKKHRSLCSVDFASKDVQVSEPAPAVELHQTDTVANIVETIRVRESEIDAALWNSETGEYHKPPPKPTGNNRAAADSWVKGALKRYG